MLLPLLKLLKFFGEFYAEPWAKAQTSETNNLNLFTRQSKNKLLLNLFSLSLCLKQRGEACVYRDQPTSLVILTA